MRFERTASYIRFHFWRITLQWTIYEKNKIKTRSTKTICRMITLTSKLDVSDIRQMRDYLSACLRDEESK